MKFKFTKMQGCGNDYIYVNGFTEKIPQEEKTELVRHISDRHFGIGGDGVIFINPSLEADFEMEMYNADGSRAEMCGNGIRCVAKYVYDKGLTDKTDISVISCGQIKYLQLFLKEGRVDTVRVNMGAPELSPSGIPVLADGDKVLDAPIMVDGREYRMTCVSMGNPHCVAILQEDVRGLDLEKVGPLFEKHERFPKRVKTDFVNVLDEETIRMRVWERGSGETYACGTGACATVSAAVVNGLCPADTDITVRLIGGELKIRCCSDRTVLMTGKAKKIYEGVYDYEPEAE